jgi:hypothetical protein
MRRREFITLPLLNARALQGCGCSQARFTGAILTPSSAIDATTQRGNHAEEALMPAEMWMFLVQVLAGIMLLVLALVAVNTYVEWCHAYKAGRALNEWPVAIVRAGWCEEAGEVLPRRNYVQLNANR